MRTIHHASRSAVFTVLGLVLASIVAGALPVSASSQAPTADASAQLASARAVREQADNRLAELQIQHTQLKARLASTSSRTTALAAEMASARRAARQSAVNAYVTGGDASGLAAMLTSDKASDASAKTAIIASQAQSAINAAEHYRALRDQSSHSVTDLGAQMDSLNQKIADATSDAEQAGALEADAERAVAQATAAQQAQAAKAAAARAAARQASTTQPGATKSAKKPRTVRAATVTTLAALTSASPNTGTTTTVPQPSGGNDMWAALRKCESGGNYAAVSASGRYRGAYQFDQQTWESVGGTGDPAAATPAEQDYRAKLLYQRRGARAWPTCGLNLPDN
jgi:hypothetical protein